MAKTFNLDKLEKEMELHQELRRQNAIRFYDRIDLIYEYSFNTSVSSKLIRYLWRRRLILSTFIYNAEDFNESKAFAEVANDTMGMIAILEKRKFDKK